MHLQVVIFLVSILFAAPSIKDDAANDYCDRHRQEWQQVWREFDVDCYVAESVIFPELIRYSLFKDRIETGTVKALYITRGPGGCDFSIGPFQMKPSFVEGLEKRWMRSGLARKYNLFFDTKDSENARKVRISRMEKEEWQCIYLAVFLKMLYLDYGSVDKREERTQNGIDSLPVKEQVRLAATAYNRGCRWVSPGYGRLEEISTKSREKHFHTAVVPTANTRRYVYADIALKHFKDLAVRTRTTAFMHSASI